MSEQTRSKRDYEWYKSLGLCVACHKQPVEPGHVYCLACLMERRGKHYNSSPETSQKHKQYLKELREKNRKNGICVVCGKNPVMPGKSYCVKCKEQSKHRAAKKRLKAGMMPRFMMGDGIRCYFCGKPSCGEKLCPECLARCQKQMLYARSFRSNEPNLFEQSCKKSYELNMQG